MGPWAEAPPLLAGVRVLELSQLIAAPLCGLQLLDLGAEVVKVEPPGGEEGRRMPPFAAGDESLWFQVEFVNRAFTAHKRSQP